LDTRHAGDTKGYGRKVPVTSRLGERVIISYKMFPPDIAFELIVTYLTFGLFVPIIVPIGTYDEGMGR
jgi:hypothetical protein